MAQMHNLAVLADSLPYGLPSVVHTDSLQSSGCSIVTMEKFVEKGCHRCTN